MHTIGVSNPCNGYDRRGFRDYQFAGKSRVYYFSPSFGDSSENFWDAYAACISRKYSFYVSWVIYSGATGARCNMRAFFFSRFLFRGLLYEFRGEKKAKKLVGVDFFRLCVEM